MNYFRCSGGADTSMVTANADDVLSSKVIVDVNGNPLIGKMPNNGTINQSLNCGQSYTIPKGYHDGNGKITANSLASQTSANATAAQILSGYTAWVNGNKITGNATASKYAIGCLVTGKDWFTEQSVNLGFRPKVVVVYHKGYDSEGYLAAEFVAFCSDELKFVCYKKYNRDLEWYTQNSSYDSPALSLTDNGFSVNANLADGYYEQAMAWTSGYGYYYAYL